MIAAKTSVICSCFPVPVKVKKSFLLAEANEVMTVVNLHRKDYNNLVMS